MNTEIYPVNLHIHSECEMIRTRKTLNTDTFYSVQYALLLFIKNSEISVDKKECVKAVPMDLSKAFAANYELLIAKLHAYDFSKNVLKLLLSYIYDN